MNVTLYMLLHSFMYMHMSVAGWGNAVGNVLTADTSLTADTEVASWIPARSHTFVEIDHEIISKAILLPSANSRKVVVSYKWKSCAQSTG